MKNSIGYGNRKRILAGLLAASLGLALCGCSANETQKAEYEANIAVNIYEAHKGPMDTYARNTASVTPYKEIVIIPRVSGTVESLPFDIGEKVRVGDVLFTIDDTDIRLQVAQAEAGYLSAKANYDRTVGGSAQQQILQLETAHNTAKVNADDAKLALDRTQELFDIGAASQQVLEGAKSRYDLALEQYNSARNHLDLTRDRLLSENEAAVLASLRQAKAAYDLAFRQLSNTVVTSDIDGMIGMRTLSKGATAAQGTPAMSVIDISRVILEFGVSDGAINLIEAGKTKVEIKISALGDRVYEGTVRAIAPAADTRTMMYNVKVEIDNSDGSIKPGMFASIKIILKTLEEVIAVPCNAVIERGGKSYVYVVEDGRANEREVTVGISNETVSQILEGIDEGEAVVIKGQSLLEDGVAVTVIGS